MGFVVAAVHSRNQHQVRYRLNIVKHGTVPLGAAILAVVATVSTAGCGTEGPLRGSNPAKPVNSLGCYTGPATLSASPAHARPGEVVTLAASGLPRNGVVELESWGLLGTASHGHFAASWGLGAVAHGSGRHPGYSKAEPGVAIAGVGLPNRPFDIAVPPVPDGNYLVQFEYSAAPASPGPGRPVSYTLCAPLQVSR